MFEMLFKKNILSLSSRVRDDSIRMRVEAHLPLQQIRVNKKGRVDAATLTFGLRIY